MRLPRSLLLLLLTGLPATALADLKVCNQTDATASVAIGYNDSGTWTSEG